MSVDAVTTGIESEAITPDGSRAEKKFYEDAVRWAKDQYVSIRNQRTITERQWYLNLAFFFGKQNVALLRPNAGPTTSTKLWVPPAPYYRSRPVINRIRATVRTELAQLTGNRPNATVVPASAEDRDMYAAMAGEQIWYNLYTEHNLRKKIRQAMWWTLITGTGYIKCYWDFMAQSLPVGGAAGAQNGQGFAEANEGNIVFSPETPFHICVPDFREESLEGQPWLIHAQAKSKEYIQMHFPQLKPVGTNASEILEDSFLNLVGTKTGQNQGSVLVLECWIKPKCHPMFPEGAFFTVVGDQIVQGYRSWPFRHGQYPFSKFDHIPAGKFYSTSLVEDLIPLQKEYNRTRGQIIEAKNRMAKPQLLAARGSVDPSKITTEPGQVIQYIPGFPEPKPMPLSPLPNYVLQELETIRLDWADLAGQHEVTHGQVPPGVTAATAISYLQERDESKLSHTFDSLEEGIEKLAKMALSYVHDYWQTERIIRVTGPDGSFDAMAFKGSDLDNNLDIRIEAGSALPTSKAAKQALIMDLMKMNFIDPQKGLEVMDMGGINKIYEQVQVDQRQAQRENLRMSRVDEQMMMEHNMNNAAMMEADPTAFDGLAPPIIVPVNTWDNHRIHIEIHNNYRKGQAFESLPAETKALFEAHVNQHIMALGIETQTMDPRAAAGLPPMMEGEQENVSQGEKKPGPEVQPELEGEAM